MQRKSLREQVNVSLADFRGGKHSLCVSGGCRLAQDDFMPAGPPQSAGRPTQCYLQVGAPVHTASRLLANTRKSFSHIHQAGDVIYTRTLLPQI